MSRRLWTGCGVMLVLLLGGCGNPDQQLRDAAAQAAREAASDVGTAALAVEQLRASRVWPQAAGQLVADAEKGVERAVGSFAAQQPSTDASRRVYADVTRALGDAQQAVTATRIALGNDDLAAAARELGVLRRTGVELSRIAASSG
ncbi:hypothetical protein [Kribbella speibonae]|uniref:DUF4398 domain-containing protein n=1 Tax=Kribbella speibonae TaxID=1572660 RepID=A0A4R0IFN8_9ACTN|nr:hypothetical protein [Kribbella speibonae]TCC30854.1 hypothetical protein E0H92_37745 [Kribbella speibonae]